MIRSQPRDSANSMTFRRTLPLLVVLIAGCARGPSSPPAQEGTGGRVEIGEAGLLSESTPAPSIPFLLMDGTRVSMADFRGRTVLVNFWATWCGPCVREMPWLASVRDRIGAGSFEIVGIATAEPDTSIVGGFIRANPVPYPIALDPSGAVADAFGGVYAMPTSFLVDPSGTVRYRFLGVIPEDAPIDSLVAVLAAGARP